MANKTINTRIKNRFDTLSNWQGDGVGLLPGEIALVSTTVAQTDSAGNIVNVPAVLMKVGAYKKDARGNNTTELESFSNLPWVSAIAADVYDWAKGENAEDVEVSVIKSGSTATSQTLATWIKEVYDKGIANAGDIAKNTAAINTLTGGSTGSLQQAISSALDELDFADNDATVGSAGSTAGKFVTVVTQNNGQIAVTKRAIAEIDLPNIHASKIIITDAVGTPEAEGYREAVTLPSKLSEINGSLEANATNITNITKTGGIIDTRITYKLATLKLDTDPTSGGEAADTENFVTQVRQNNGQVSYLTKTLPKATNSKFGIIKLGATGGAATYDSIFGTDGNGGINAQVNQNKADIEGLANTVSRGVNFRGEVETAPTGSTYTLKDTTEAKNAILGDIVICGEKEYIYTANSTWKELGDLSRVGAVEGWHSHESTAGTYTKVIVDGKGHVTGGSNPTTLAGYGITDAYTKGEVYTQTEVNAELNKKSDTTHTHAISAGAEDDNVVVLAGTSGTLGVSYKATHAASGVTAGIYKSVTVDAKGHVTGGSNPTTIADFGITDAYTKTEVNAELAKKSGTDHTHSDYVNQNAFSGISVGSTTVAADTATDTVEFAGNNITITPDAANDKITFSVTKADASGETGIVTLSDAVSNSSETAATSKAVYTVNEKAVDAQSRVTAVEGNYIKYNSTTKHMYIGAAGDNTSDKANSDYVIFDCGNATGWA